MLIVDGLSIKRSWKRSGLKGQKSLKEYATSLLDQNRANENGAAVTDWFERKRDLRHTTPEQLARIHQRQAARLAKVSKGSSKAKDKDKKDKKGKKAA